MANQYGLGWLPDTPDLRDYKYASPVRAQDLPTNSVLVYVPPIQNQGRTGSCTGQAAGSLHAYCQHLQKDPTPFDPSRLAIYWATRYEEGTVNQDSGAQIRTAIKVLVKYGAAPVEMWPYVESRFREKPPQSVWTEAEKNQATVYGRVPFTLDAVKGCIAADRYPFEFGFNVHASFDKAAKDGRMPMPGRFSDPVQGGHAVYCIGYDDSQRLLLCVNSWSEQWGNRGKFTMPYDFFFGGEASDAWTVRAVETDTITPPQPEPAPPAEVQSITVHGFDLKVTYG